MCVICVVVFTVMMRLTGIHLDLYTLGVIPHQPLASVDEMGVCISTLPETFVPNADVYVYYDLVLIVACVRC